MLCFIIPENTASSEVSLHYSRAAVFPKARAAACIMFGMLRIVPTTVNQKLMMTGTGALSKDLMALAPWLIPLPMAGATL